MLNIANIRKQFPGLARSHGSQNAIFFDGPAGSQVPVQVADEVRRFMLHHNANEGGAFATSKEVGQLMDTALDTMAAFYGDVSPNIAFGANMTTLTLHFTRAIAETLSPDDEIIVTRLDHDANVTPWVLAAKKAGATIKYIPLNSHDCTLDLSVYKTLLTPKTKWVAVGLASNATGGINPIRAISDLAHSVGAKCYVDAVHYAPHGRIQIQELGCDALVSSAYKFFGPHIGMLWAEADLLQELPAFKVRPATDEIPFRWMTGTPNYACISGTIAAIQYIASLSGAPDETSLSERLNQSFSNIQQYENRLSLQLLNGLNACDGVTVWGITDPQQIAQRVPTFSLTFDNYTPKQVAHNLAEKGIYVWSGNHYALQFSESMGLEPGGTLRVGLLHYNTESEVDRLLDALHQL